MNVRQTRSQVDLSGQNIFQFTAQLEGQLADNPDITGPPEQNNLEEGNPDFQQQNPAAHIEFLRWQITA